jgi:hypothetical protein
MCKISLNTKKVKCSLCGELLETNHLGWDLGNNPHPLMKKDSDRCCDNCNTIYVLPIRKLVYKLKDNPMYHKMVNSRGWLKNIKGSMELIKYSNFLI